MSLEALKKYIQNNDNVVIAIDGPSGGGKTTLAKNLERDFDCLVFHTDDYFLHPDRKTKDRLNEPGGFVDYERMKSEIFDNIKNDLIPSDHFNCMTNQLESRKPRTKKRVIVVEGVYSMHPLFLEYYDYLVYININVESQKQRILARNGEMMLNRFVDEWIPLEDKYFEFFAIKQQANLVLDFTQITYNL